MEQNGIEQPAGDLQGYPEIFGLNRLVADLDASRPHQKDIQEFASWAKFLCAGAFDGQTDNYSTVELKTSRRDYKLPVIVTCTDNNENVHTSSLVPDKLIDTFLPGWQVGVFNINQRRERSTDINGNKAFRNTSEGLIVIEDDEGSLVVKSFKATRPFLSPDYRVDKWAIKSSTSRDLIAGKRMLWDFVFLHKDEEFVVPAN